MKVFCITGTVDELIEAKLAPFGLQTNRISGTGYSPTLRTDRCLRVIVATRAEHFWFSDCVAILRRLMPNPISFIRTSGWPELGKVFPSDVGINGDTFFPCNDTTVKSAIFSNLKSSIWDLQLVGACTTHSIFPVFEHFFSIDSLDIGLSPFVCGILPLIDELTHYVCNEFGKEICSIIPAKSTSIEELQSEFLPSYGAPICYIKAMPETES
jgi:hypothetical protein